MREVLDRLATAGFRLPTTDMSPGSIKLGIRGAPKDTQKRAEHRPTLIPSSCHVGQETNTSTFDECGRNPIELVGLYFQPVEPLPVQIVPNLYRSHDNRIYYDNRPLQPTLFNVYGRPTRFDFCVSSRKRLRFCEADEAVRIIRTADRERFDRNTEKAQAQDLAEIDMCEMIMDRNLRSCLEAAQANHSRNGLRIEEAAIGIRISHTIASDREKRNIAVPKEQHHRVIGFRLEGMDKLGWIDCRQTLSDYQLFEDPKRYDVLLMNKRGLDSSM